MDCRTERDARAFVAEWAAEYGYGHRLGAIREVARGLAMSLSIMDGAPHRYTSAQREEGREAVAYLRQYLAECQEVSE